MLSLLTHTQIMKKETQKRLVVGMILSMQWMLMIGACTAFYYFYANNRLIDLFCGFFFFFFSFQAHKMRGLYIKQVIGADKAAEFFIWLKKQNRATRRHHGFKMANSMKKGRHTTKKRR